MAGLSLGLGLGLTSLAARRAGADVGFGAHAYWRILCANNHGDATGISLAEVEMRGTSGGGDQCTGGTAIGSDDAAGNEFAMAFDNNSATSWFANSGPTDQWIGYHFASPVEVNEVALTFDTTSLTRQPKDCIVEYSDDGSSWTSAFSFTIYGGLLGDTREYPEPTPAAGYHRFWRIFCLNNNGGTSFIILDEVEFRATSGGADQCATLSGANGGATGRAIFSTQSAGNEGWRAFDGTTGAWAGSGTINQWIGYIFPDPVKVEEISLTGTTQTTRMPNDIQVEYSDDGTNWTNQKSINDLTWSSNETKVLTAL